MGIFNQRIMVGILSKSLLVVSIGIGLLLGMLIKYRVKFSLWLAVYMIFIFPVWAGSAIIIILANMLGGNRSLVVCAYLASILLPLLVSLLSSLWKANFLDERRLRKGVERFWGEVKFEKSIIYSIGKNAKKNTGSLSSLIGSMGIVVVNVPLLFKVYTGSRDNVIFLLVPLMIGTFAYLGAKSVGPYLANLYLLRRYEKQTGRRFVNADYEKFQALRRTFFLSRWLMKDYRAVSSTPLPR